MPTTCPKCDYTRQKSDYAPDYECPACGIVYRKYLNKLANDPFASKEKAIDRPKVLVSAAWKPETRRGTLIFMLLFTLITLFYIREIVSGLNAKDWPKTTGVITSSYLSSGGRGGDRLNISYDYAITAKHYQNDRFNFGLLSLNGHSSSAQHAADRHPIGKRMAVYYQESDPANSVLENKLDLNDNLLFVLGLLSAVGITAYFRFF
ncbi:MAG: DUF3592 domain-containing protein [Methylomonas sp.]|jgi:hypothetical protein|uniref:DUF3592 domain-containing protein n=1 Tax=Methylomonas sp. TaxID=418 RepID=UPI0025F23DB8|nr:DUF3592 domain-containing protein [Methylomonas sp.]MCK9606640.1 DUF3592 domain-containing protein [Methylomonas sp.]